MARQPTTHSEGESLTLNPAQAAQWHTFQAMLTASFTDTLGVERKIGEFPIDTTVPVLFARGWTHGISNEQASKVTSWIRKELGHTKDTPVSKEQVESYRVANADAVAAKMKEFQDEFVTAALEGKLNERRGGGMRMDAVGKLALALATASIGAAIKIKVPGATQKAIDAKVAEILEMPEQLAKWRGRAEAQLNAPKNDADMEGLDLTI